HWSHLYGFSPVCTLLCILRFSESVKPLPQMSQTYGFSPVWIRLCFFKCSALLRLLPQ
ncbi:hypothetical protein WN51_05475, partial [Melipona quadrifasciata]